MQYVASGFLKVGAAVLGITVDRYNEVKAAKRSCLFAVEVEEKLNLLLANYYEFETELLKQAESFVIWPKLNHESAMLARLSIDRRLVNLLTSCRLYLDQTDHGFSQLYGNPSPELSNLIEFRHDLYDSHFGYRLLEALRNHVQHSGLPVHVFTRNISLIKGAIPNYGQHVVIPQTKPETLAENESFKKSVLAELCAMGKEVDLRVHVRDYISCLVQVHLHIRTLISSKITADRTVYNSACTEYSTINSQAVQVPHLIAINEDGSHSEQIALSTEILSYYESLVTRNTINPSIYSAFASNSIQK